MPAPRLTELAVDLFRLSLCPHQAAVTVVLSDLKEIVHLS